ncbi:fibulin-1 [Stegastes partitus]|uniref:Fibulin-1 n=1 Tax=Stegastes partitus TaxID=144197 RepID=A0A9Y4KDL4_9TELE|nr:PREDICTED: fibulin-1-like [Stegastes partitus]
MALCALLLCALVGVLRGQEQITIEDCCKDGQKRGNDNEDCAALPLISGSATCRIVQEQCCVTVLEDNMCTTGINMAKDQSACDSLFTNTCETKTTKMCCDCCLLGKAAQENGISCDHNLSVGYQCSLVSRACCVDGASDNQTAPTPQTELLNQDDNTEHPAPSDECSGKCAHRCAGNDTCACFTGYKLKPDGKSCEDINECLLGASNCRAGERCINTEGSFRCQREVSCGTGYELTDSNNCKDIDECDTGIHNCGPEFECQNTQGSFRCLPKVKCGAGFIQDALGNCIDINEFLCADLNECESNPCSQECANVYGSYQCYCRRGYQLSDIDGMTCEDIDECALPTGGHICSYRCHNTPGSFHCSCPTSGYTLAVNGRSCQDIDECLTGRHTCTENQSCFNVQGGFRCLSFECPSNYRRVGETVARLERSDTIRCMKSCQSTDIACVLDPTHSISHTFISLPTFREFTRPEEIVFLRTTVPAYGTYHLGSYDVKFDILEGNVENAFDIIKRVEHGMYVGVVRQVKPLIGPMTTILKLSMRNLTGQGDSGQNIINVHMFVSEYWF